MASREEIIYTIALRLIARVGNGHAADLIQYFGSAKALFDCKDTKLLQVECKLKPSAIQAIINQTTVEQAAKEWDFCQKFGINILTKSHADYPKRLRNCHDAPTVLFFKGKANLNMAKVVAIVGTRKPTEQGKIFCERLIEDLASYNILYASGLAYGIDITAHKKATDLGIPNIGVVAHGLDTIYPPKHKPLAQRMVSNGGILTEFVSETPPLGKHFPMRNRIIAGMADAVVVIETAERGGSMITAHFANEFNKDVFAVPGRINDPYSKGCNHLIKTHRASLVQSAADIAYIMNWEQQKKSIQKQLFVDLSADEQRLVDLLVGEEGVHLDTIITQTQISTSKIAAALLELEFKGMLRALPGKRFRLI